MDVGQLWVWLAGYLPGLREFSLIRFFFHRLDLYGHGERERRSVIGLGRESLLTLSLSLTRGASWKTCGVVCRTPNVLRGTVIIYFFLLTRTNSYFGCERLRS